MTRESHRGGFHQENNSRSKRKDTWRRMAEKERIEFVWRSGVDIKLAKDRTESRSFVRALRATGSGKE